VAEGDVAGASRLLGRVHELRGPVSRGDGRGGPELGFPTANVHVEASMAVPAVGIYSGWYRDEELDARPAAISVGRRPTFYESADPLVEAHLIGFDGDLYGRTARISFLDRLRDEERFEDVDALIAQMRLDVERAAEQCAAAADRAPGAGRAP
jgi:riboflavin kinase/FMN adenylyltransferase